MHGYLSTIFSAINILHTLLTLFTLFVCWQYRRISSWMNLVVAGLAGMILVTVSNFVPWTISPTIDDLATAVKIAVPSLLSLVAWGLFVFGLAATFKDIRGRIAPDKDFLDDLG